MASSLQDLLRNRVESAGVPLKLTVDDESVYAASALPAFYERRAYHPAWTNEKGLLPEARSLLNAIQRAEEQGLRPADYHLDKVENLLPKTRRDFSSGCIRIEKPLELAEYLLKNHPDWPPGKVRAALTGDDRVENTIKLVEPVNIHILYWTVWIGKDDLIHFGPDIYDRDKTLDEALQEPPPGFVEVTPDNEDTLVSPHFKLKQFLCNQNGGYHKYLVLKEKLLLKLELILEKVNAKGYRCNTFHVMSGYRTPYYNEAIGNVKHSRHIYGGAADIFIDENPQDNMMDDLNRDGNIDYRDAAVIYRIIDELYGKEFYDPFLGGLARYKKTGNHGPFVHVDVRGRRARWGD